MNFWENKSLELLSITIDSILYTEEWKPIDGFLDKYEISSFGRIKSKNRIIAVTGQSNRNIKERIISIQRHSNEYLFVNLWSENKEYYHSVHRLVGNHFLDNPDNLPEINHKFGNKQDNFYLNLEWSTHGDNVLHSYNFLNHKKSNPMLGKTGKLHPNSKRIYCPTLSIYFESSRIAEKELGISQGTISDICRGKQLQRNGLVFNFA